MTKVFFPPWWLLLYFETRRRSLRKPNVSKRANAMHALTWFSWHISQCQYTSVKGTTHQVTIYIKTFKLGGGRIIVVVASHHQKWKMEIFKFHAKEPSAFSLPFDHGSPPAHLDPRSISRSSRVSLLSPFYNGSRLALFPLFNYFSGLEGGAREC